MDLDFLDGQLKAMKDLPCNIYPGIEINILEPIVHSTPEYLTESLSKILDYGYSGAVLSWNIMQAPDENIHALNQFSK